MTAAKLTIDLGAIAANWTALDRLSAAETGAVVKADAYGLGAAQVAPRLALAGARKFFVAQAEEGHELRQILGPGPDIFVFSGHMPGDSELLRASDLIPLINSARQMLSHVEQLYGHPFGLQLDTGMNRLGMEAGEWAAIQDIALGERPSMIMSHLACADDPDHHMNTRQLRNFRNMTDGFELPRSLSATGGITLGQGYHFDITRPGIGLYGGLPYADALPVVTIDLPVIQIREVRPNETVGYGNSWQADRLSRVATVSGGYADGLLRALGPKLTFTSQGQKCQIAGRVSMDLITVDITDLDHQPETLQLVGPRQSIDTIAEFGDTIGYEILTSLGRRYDRTYIG